MALPRFDMRRFLRLILFGVLAYALFYAMAFVHMYRDKHAYVAASEWIFENVPPGSLISGPHWDDRLPLSIEGKSAPTVFRMEGPGTDLLVYERDTPQKIDELLDVVSKSDYIVFPTPRVQGSIPRIAEEYPHTTAFFQLLWSGKLGFTLVASFKTRPSLFGISFNDDLADESFSVYDHPKVTIFKNTERFSKDLLKQRVSLPVQFEPLPTLDEILRADSGSWLSRGGFATLGKHGWYHALVALVLIEVAAFGCLVLSASFFPFAPDRGWGAIKILTLLALTVPTWGLAAAGYGGGGFIGTRGVVLGFGSVISIGALSLSILRPSIRHLVWNTWRSYGKQAECVFLSVFTLFFLLRSFTPELATPEHMRSVALLNHLARTGAVPPHDPWAAGTMLHLPYLGLYLLGTASHALGIPHESSYDFSAALVAALVASAAYSLFLTFSTRRFHAALVAGGVCIFGSWQLLLEGLRVVSRSDTAVLVANSEVAIANVTLVATDLLRGELTPTVLALPLGALFLFLLRGIAHSIVHGEQANVFCALLLGVVFGCLMGTSGIDSAIYGTAAVAITVATLVATYNRDRTWAKIAAWKAVPAGAAAAITCSIIAFPYLVGSTPISVFGQGTVRALSLETTPWNIADILAWGSLVAVLVMCAVLLRCLKCEYCCDAASRSIVPRERRMYFVLLLTLMPWIFAEIAAISGMARPTWSIAIASSIIALIAALARLPWRNEVDESFLRGLIIAAALSLPVCEVVGISAGGTICDVTALTFAAAISVLVVWDRSHGSVIQPGRKIFSVACVGLIVIIALGVAAFGLSAISLVREDWTHREAASSQSALVRWLNRTVRGDAILLLSPGRSAAQISALTGLSTLSAWIEPHSTRLQFRGDDPDRVKVVDQIYASVHTQQAYDLLMQYGVDLIVISQSERLTYPQYGLRKFAGHTDLFAPIYDVDGVIVYTPAFSRLYPHD